MRFKGIPAHCASEAKSVRKWQPPDHMRTRSQDLYLQPTYKQSFQKPKKDDMPPSCLGSVPSRQIRMQENHSLFKGDRKHEYSRWGKKRVEGHLPFPSTHYRVARGAPRLRFWQRLFSLLMAMCVSESFLSGLMTSPGDRLQEATKATGIETRREPRNATTFDDLKRLQNGTKVRPPGRGFAALLGASNTATKDNVLIEHPERSFWSRLRRSILLMEKLTAMVRAQSKGVVTLYMIQNGEYVSRMLTFRSAMVSFDSKQRPELQQKKMYDIYGDLFLGKVQAPLQVSALNAQLARAKGSKSSSGQHGIRHAERSLPSGIVGTALQNDQKVPNKWEPSKVHRQSNKKSYVLHSDALNVVGNIESVSVPSNGVRSKETKPDTLSANALQPTVQSNPIPEKRNHRQHSESSLKGHIGLQQGVHLLAPDGIQIWDLEAGRSVCRIHNVARLSDGTLILPKWMESLVEFLHTRCGVKRAIYAVENAFSQRGLTVDNDIIVGTKKFQSKLDLSYGDRDLFGITAPRNHMPHFVTDVLLPLASSETFIVSPRGPLQFSTLHWSTGFRAEGTSCPSLQQLKPAILVFDETMNRPLSDWVPRLAHFFEHPKLDFKLVSAGMERATKDQKGKDFVALVFRSVVMSNLIAQEPVGLFGPNGNNCVLAANGVSRDPPWTMMEMRGTPCRVQVTVLTRKGPRALLKLKELRDRIKSSTSSEHVAVDFQIVDFGKMSFDKQVRTMQSTNVLVATHGAGNANFIFMRPGAAVIEVFPFSYKAGPFDSFARIFGLVYNSVMSAPQTDVFKECMTRHETNQTIKKIAFKRWDEAVAKEKVKPWVHQLEFEKEFGDPGKSQGMTTRGCVRLQELEFNVDEVTRMAVKSGREQCSAARRR